MSSIYEKAVQEFSLLNRPKEELDQYFQDCAKVGVPGAIKALEDANLLDHELAARIALEMLQRLVLHRPLSAIPAYSEETKDQWFIEPNDPISNSIQNRRYSALFYNRDSNTYSDVSAFYYEPDIGGCYTGRRATDETVKLFGQWMGRMGLLDKMSSTKTIRPEEMPYYPTDDALPIKIHWHEHYMFDAMYSAMQFMEQPGQNPQRGHTHNVINYLIWDAVTIDNMHRIILAMQYDTGELVHFVYPLGHDKARLDQSMNIDMLFQARFMKDLMGAAYIVPFQADDHDPSFILLPMDAEPSLGYFDIANFSNVDYDSAIMSSVRGSMPNVHPTIWNSAHQEFPDFMTYVETLTDKYST